MDILCKDFGESVFKKVLCLTFSQEENGYIEAEFSS